jgi:aspartate beta-hydroxylase
MNTTIETLAATLERARNLAAQGRGDDAHAAYERVLAMQPEHAEASAFFGARELARNQTTSAIEWFERARANDAANPQILLALGNAYLIAQKFEQALDVFARCVALAPKAFVARLQYAQALEALGRDRAALAQYYSAITQAQRDGRWLSDASTAPPLRDTVKRAMRLVYEGRKRLFEALLAPLVERHGEAAMARASKCLKIYLGQLPPDYPDPRQIPTFMYFPDLPPTTYFARSLFPWYEALEAATDSIRAEMQSVLEQPDALKPFLGEHSPEATKAYLGGIENPVWNAYFFYRHGERYAEHHARCPRTSAALDAVTSLVHIREHAPEVCYSVLTPGTHILKHRGVTNTRLVTHLPLIIPDHCAINVGGEEKVWRIGEAFSFDDTFEHEAWNRSDRTRVVMLMDVWNPYLTPAECDAVTRLVEGIGDFNAEAGIDRV